MKILLISANTLKIPYPVYPLGLDYVAGCLDSRHQTKIIDMNDLGGLDELGTQIRNFAPEVIGLSIRNIDNTDATNSHAFWEDYHKIVWQIRENSEAILILGGSGFTIFPIEFMQSLDADYGIAGEGEKLPLLLDALATKQDVALLPGVLTKATTDVVHKPWDREIERSFNSESTHTRFYVAKGGMLNLQTKRGCPFHCIYCTYPHIDGCKMRFFSPDKIAREARALQEAGAQYIFITDSAFNASYDHSREVAQAFIKARVSLPWGGFFAPTTPPPDYFKVLADAGLSHVEFGTESLSDKMLINLRKPFTVREAISAHDSALQAGLHVAHYFLLGGPGEDVSTLKETIDHVNSLEKAVFFFFCSIRIYPHTNLYETALREGQIVAGENLLRPVFYKSPYITDSEIKQTVEDYSAGRPNWVVGSGENKVKRLLPKLYNRGFTGPMWERLIQ